MAEQKFKELKRKGIFARALTEKEIHMFADHLRRGIVKNRLARKYEHFIDDSDIEKIMERNNEIKDEPVRNGPVFTREMHENSKTIAEGTRIRKIDILLKRFGGTRRGWKKKKTVDQNGQEWHYYEHHGIGIKGEKREGDLDPF